MKNTVAACSLLSARDRQNSSFKGTRLSLTPSSGVFWAGFVVGCLFSLKHLERRDKGMTGLIWGVLEDKGSSLGSLWWKISQP